MQVRRQILPPRPAWGECLPRRRDAETPLWPHPPPSSGYDRPLLAIRSARNRVNRVIPVAAGREALTARRFTVGGPGSLAPGPDPRDRPQPGQATGRPPVLVAASPSSGACHSEPFAKSPTIPACFMHWFVPSDVLIAPERHGALRSTHSYPETATNPAGGSIWCLRNKRLLGAPRQVVRWPSLAASGPRRRPGKRCRLRHWWPSEAGARSATEAARVASPHSDLLHHSSAHNGRQPFEQRALKIGELGGPRGGVGNDGQCPVVLEPARLAMAGNRRPNHFRPAGNEPSGDQPPLPPSRPKHPLDFLADRPGIETHDADRFPEKAGRSPFLHDTLMTGLPA
jgi:hypothetical protein